MKTIDFLKSVLGNNGLYCAWGKLASNEKIKVQQFYKTIEDLEAASYEYDKDGYDIYFALGTFKEEGIGEKGGRIVEGRVAENVQEMRSMFIDLDVGEKKDYPTQLDAAIALSEFVNKTGLPEPMTVNSGNGIHVYWNLSEPVTKDEWLPVAQKLKSVCKNLGLRIDTSRTADASSILRMPQTHNRKSETPLPVKFMGDCIPTPILLQDFNDVFTTDEYVEVDDTYTFGSAQAFDVYRDNKRYDFDTIMKKTMEGKGCTQLAHIVMNQAKVDEPLWVSALSIAKFCDDSETIATRISDEHPEFNEEVMQKKLDGIKHRHTCITFNDRNPNICEKCPHWNDIRSPLDLGVYVVEAEPEEDIPTYPAPYFRGKNGGVYMRINNDDGVPEDVMIYHNDLYVMKRLHDTEQGEIALFHLRLPKDGVREFSIPLAGVTSTDEFRKNMSAQGVTAVGARLKQIMDYSMRWIDELQQQGPADVVHNQFGWTDDTFTEFVLGDKLVTPNGSKFSPPSPKTAGLIQEFVPKGSKERQKQLFGFYNREGFELHRFIIGMGFGSVLMPFTGFNSMLLHMFGGSGVGKTTAQMMALSIWGHPEHLMNQKSDTYNSIMNRGETLHNIMFCIDEMTNVTGLEFSDFIYQFSGGRQRNRLHQSGNYERKRGRPWELLGVTSANISAWEMLKKEKDAPEAEMQRLLEIDVPSLIKPDPKLKSVTDILFRDIKQNYGWFAEEYIQWVMNNKEHAVALIRDAQNKIDEHAGLSQENRFWSAGCGVALVGLLIANKLGIVSYPMDKQFDWVVDMLKRQKVSVAEAGSSVSEVITDFIGENWSNVLHIRSDQDLRSDVEEIAIPKASPRMRLVARYEMDRKKLFILPTPLREWCATKQINYGQLVKDLKKEMNAKTNVLVRFGKGTEFKLPPKKALELDFGLSDKNEPKSIEN